ncbi:MAG: PD-(D/E)XK nuclease family transposase [Agathobacter sp.]|nr:PD-(D/E)XK nuclease family transposase [Agathobacter sp.]
MTNEYKLKEILGEPISREEALQIIQSDYTAYLLFQDFPADYQNQVLEFIQGIRGLPILYDSFFQNILNPSVVPERLERFLSSLMNQQIHIVQVIPREGSQLVDKGSFVIMDILVQTKNGSYINVEMQKHGYEFTGERSTCYMSDLVMRQYSQVKAEKKKKFSFKDLKPVYLIVLMENSTKNFKVVAPKYIHRVHYTCDTGADVNFLANYTYISLDTFRSVGQNISSYLDAWFTFLSSDAPEDILKLIESYPEFKEYYHDIALFRKKPKELIAMYSEALIQMDKNTANYMIEEMQKEVEELHTELDEKNAYIKKLESQLGIQNE